MMHLGANNATGRAVLEILNRKLIAYDRRPKPGDSMEAIMFNAGAHKALSDLKEEIMR